MHPAKNPGPSEVQVISPGRINLIGEDTDYNQGYVLPAAVPEVVARLKAAYRERFGREAAPLEVVLADGVRRGS
jgi:hypothetical protein